MKYKNVNFRLAAAGCQLTSLPVGDPFCSHVSWSRAAIDDRKFSVSGPLICSLQCRQA